MNKKYFTKKAIFAELAVLLILVLCLTLSKTNANIIPTFSPQKNYIKWVDFTVSYHALDLAYTYDVESYGEEVHINWIELLAYCAAKTGGQFSNSTSTQMSKVVEELKNKDATMDSLTENLKYYSYYLEAYNAVLGGLVGEYEVETYSETEPGHKIWVEKYGLKGFSPIAKGYYYNDYDDFGVSRSYGFKRQHLGHDLMGSTGTPIIAVESGYVEAMGWNQYGGWRLGIRSFDKKRYYYYAHLRKDLPYNTSLTIGSVVSAGDVIGYLGRTGYSNKENTNNIDTSHLHFGIQLIFNESQKEGNNEIWIDCYALTKFLCKNKSETAQMENSKEYTRVYNMKDPAVTSYQEHLAKKKNRFLFRLWDFLKKDEIS
ncbi:M23 family metallopeptidase [Anaeromicropila populeti]|uniref:Peptidase family M23 n=1 Tax=Anaeromicropila populeti TaxID=37658 RepID=A0A1I6JMS9_9FIRM|nr:M23 family metallopeptidase [Anaeromicropila populeti]SFR79870.1 Peptidase family M23 [Anaeromicropila populeti]